MSSLCADWSPEYHYGGIYLPEIDLWLDPHRPEENAFVSHAHADHIGKHQHVIATPATAALMASRLSSKSSKGKERQETQLEFGESFQWNGATITLYPAGHIFGSAMIHIERKVESHKGERLTSLLYTGDFKTEPDPVSEEAKELTPTPQADVLIMETTFGLPQYHFPPRGEVFEQVYHFCKSTLKERCSPVLMGYSLGKAQQLLKSLQRFADLAETGSVLMHPSIHQMTRIHEDFGLTFPPYEKLKKSHLELLAGHPRIVMWPQRGGRRKEKKRAQRSQTSQTISLEDLPNTRTAFASGWAMNCSAKYWYGYDAVFPLSDHADYRDLLKFIEDVNPQTVLTLHGYAAAFAASIRQTGRDAWNLSGADHMELIL